MLTEYQDRILKLLAEAYKNYQLDPNWATRRAAGDGGVGGYLIDRCYDNPEFTNTLLMTIGGGLCEKEDTQSYKNSLDACNMFSELYRKDEYMRGVIIKGMLDDKLSIESLDKKPDQFKQVLMVAAIVQQSKEFTKSFAPSAAAPEAERKPSPRGFLK